MDDEIKCKEVGMLSGGKWDKLHDISRRVYSADGLAPTVHTMGGGNQELKILVPEATKKGYDTATYGDSINMTYPNSKTRRGRVGHGVAQTLTTGDAQQVVVVGNYSPSGHNASKVVDPTGLAPTVMENHGTVTAITSPRIAAMRGRNPDNPSDRTAGAPTEQRLEIGSEETSNTLTTVQKDNLVVEPLVWDGFNQQVRTDSEVCGTITRNVGADLKRNGQGIVEPTIWGSKQANCAKKKDGICPTLTSAMGDGGGQIPMHNYDCRIRKLTERECFRLMGVKEQDFENVAKNQSPSSLYHLAGDSIVTACLMAIFGQLFGIDYNGKITELVKELKQS